MPKVQVHTSVQVECVNLLNNDSSVILFIHLILKHLFWNIYYLGV